MSVIYWTRESRDGKWRTDETATTDNLEQISCFEEAVAYVAGLGWGDHMSVVERTAESTIIRGVYFTTSEYDDDTGEIWYIWYKFPFAFTDDECELLLLMYPPLPVLAGDLWSTINEDLIE